jgi:hypothetical protein
LKESEKKQKKTKGGDGESGVNDGDSKDDDMAHVRSILIKFLGNCPYT